MVKKEDDEITIHLSKFKLSRFLLYLIFILVALIFVKLFFNPHFEEKEVLIKHRLTGSIFGLPFIDDVPIKNCLCVGDEVHESFGDTELVGWEGKAKCVCKETKKRLKFV